jgi:hypothetical protein
MEQVSVVAHKVVPSRVTKFVVKQTIVKEKEMTYNALSAMNDGNEAFNTYVDAMLSYTGQDIRNEKHFKLCNKSKKDHEKCKNVPRKKRRVTQKKTKSHESMSHDTNIQSPPTNVSLPQSAESLEENYESAKDNQSHEEFQSPLNETPEDQKKRTLTQDELNALKKLLNMESKSKKTQKVKKNKSVVNGAAINKLFGTKKQKRSSIVNGDAINKLFQEDEKKKTKKKKNVLPRRSERLNKLKPRNRKAVNRYTP